MKLEDHERYPEVACPLVGGKWCIWGMPEWKGLLGAKIAKGKRLWLKQLAKWHVYLSTSTVLNVYHTASPQQLSLTVCGSAMMGPEPLTLDIIVRKWIIIMTWQTEIHLSMSLLMPRTLKLLFMRGKMQVFATVTRLPDYLFVSCCAWVFANCGFPSISLQVKWFNKLQSALVYQYSCISLSL